MAAIRRPHLLGIDDGAFDKRHDRVVPIVGVMMEAHDLVEAVATTEFPIDGDDAAGFLAEWVGGLRFAAALHAVLLGGVTIAGLGVVDVHELSGRLNLPVIVVNRQQPANERLIQALTAAGLAERIPVLERLPAAWQVDGALWASHVGLDDQLAAELIQACRGKSLFPEPLRLAHLIAGAIATGQSRGRP